MKYQKLLKILIFFKIFNIQINNLSVTKFLDIFSFKISENAKKLLFFNNNIQ